MASRLPARVLLLSVLLLVVAQACAGGRPQPTPTAIPLPTQPERSPDALQTAAARPATPTVETMAVTPKATPAEESQGVAIQQTATAAPLATPTAPTPVLALGNAVSLTLRSLPSTVAPVVAVVDGSTILWAEARTADDSWLRVTDGEGGSPAWANRSDLALLGDTQRLPVATLEAIELATPPTVVPVSISGQVTAARLNVRQAPGTDQAVLGQLDRGDVITASGRTADASWLRIDWDSGEAWVASPLVELSSDVPELPVVAEALAQVSHSSVGLPGKIVFQTRSGGDLWLVNGDGTGLRRLVDGLDPALSPDGSKVAFARWTSPHGIFVLDLPSGQERRVATTNRPRFPTWSPDGEYLAFSHFTESQPCLDTPFGCVSEEALRQLLRGEECLDTPQGRLCVDDFEWRQVDNYALARISLSDGVWLDLPSDRTAQSPDYHPTSDEIIYRGTTGLMLTAANADTRLLVDDTQLGSPDWSPDGTQIVAQSYVHDHADVVLLDNSGRIVRWLTTPPASGRPPNNVSPTWSPDGRFIVFLSDRGGAWQLYRMNPDGSSQVPLLPAPLSDIEIEYEFAAEQVVSWGP